MIPNEIDRVINFACVWSLKTQNGPVPVSQMENGSNSRIPVQVLKSNATTVCSPVVDEFINCLSVYYKWIAYSVVKVS